MKRIFIILFLTFGCFWGIKGGQGTIKMTTTQTGKFSFRIITHLDDENRIEEQPDVEVDWGNGIVQKIGAIAAWAGVEVVSPHELSGVTNITVKSPGDFYRLNMNQSKITHLDVRNAHTLRILYCDNTGITSLDVSKNEELEDLNVSGNQLILLDVQWNKNLKTLYCDNNKLTKLDVSANTILKDLRCRDNSLTSLDLHTNTELVSVDCLGNSISSFDLSNNINLTNLVCTSNSISKLDVSKLTKLTKLMCATNRLTELDVSNLSKLNYLGCNFNSIKTLKVAGATELTEISCTRNQLSELDLTGLTKVKVLDLRSNSFRFSTLPKIVVNYIPNAYGAYDGCYFYAPQATVYGGEIDHKNVDLSKEYKVIRLQSNGTALAETITNYQWFDVSSGTEIAVSSSNYTNTSGKFVFNSNYIGKKLRCKMTNSSFWVEGLSSAYATDAKLTLVYEVTLTGQQSTVSSVSLSPASADINVGAEVTLIATISPDNAPNKNVTWSSSNINVASVDATGKVKGIKEGTATITVKTVDGDKTATCSVTVVAANQWNSGNVTALKGSGTKTDPYRITTPEELAFVAKQVNTGNSYDNNFLRLENDLNLAGKEWVPIGYDFYKPFKGSFDGNRKCVSNLKIEETANTYDNAGLFGVVSRGAKIYDLVLGKGSVKGKKASPGYDFSYVGGIAARAYCDETSDSIWFSNCVNMATVTGGEVAFSTGGIVGGCEAYGVNSTNGVVSIIKCINNAPITGGSRSITRTGGIIGGGMAYVSGNAGNGVIKIIECVNNSHIKGIGTDFSNTGGIIGAPDGTGAYADGTFYIRFCINNGPVTGDDVTNSYTGGVVGQIQEKVFVEQCYNYGQVKTGKGYLGGVIGGRNSSKGGISNCFFLKDENINTTVGGLGNNYTSSSSTGIYAISANDFRKRETFISKKWDFNARWMYLSDGLGAIYDDSRPWPIDIDRVPGIVTVRFKTDTEVNKAKVDGSTSLPPILPNQFEILGAPQGAKLSIFTDTIKGYFTSSEEDINVLVRVAGLSLTGEDAHRYVLLHSCVSGKVGKIGNPVIVTVSFDTRQGNPISPIKLAMGKTIPDIPTPVREGYTFAGWYKDIACTNPWNTEKDIVIADIILYAQWDKVMGYSDMDKLGISIYPNPVPTLNEFTIHMNDEVVTGAIVEIINMNGVICYKTKVNDSIIRLKSPDTPGVYFVRIICRNKSRVYKLFVE